MRRKRNKANMQTSTSGYIQKYFGAEIGRILVPSTRNLQNCAIPYVPHPEAEAYLQTCLVADPVKDKTMFFTGLTGSGKTTILRHVFSLEGNASKATIQDNTIIIPIDFNRHQLSTQEAILSSLRASIMTITELANIDFPDTSNKQFYSFIKEKRRDLLTIDGDVSPSTPPATCLKTLLSKLPVAYASCQLQYVMENEKCPLNLVLLVIDNVEASGSNSTRTTSNSKFLSPIIESFRLADCIQQRGTETRWSFNMLIACRHHIWRIMKGEFSDNSNENALLQSYVDTELPYDLSKPVKTFAIIHKTEEVLERKEKDLIKWKTAVSVVNTILNRVETSIGDFILQLELKDIRKSLIKMRDLILHSGLQKQSDEKISNGAFQIDSPDMFDLSRVNFIRIIGIGSKLYYSDNDSIIPNLLYNENAEGMELFTLLTLKYFLIKCNFTEPSWDNAIRIFDFYSSIKSIFDYTSDQDLRPYKVAIKYLIQHRLLLRSADQPQEEVPGLSNKEIEQIDRVYVSGSAIVLWNELAKSSALFQLFIDDIWLDDQEDYFGSNGNDIEHCLQYLIKLNKIEQEFLNRAHNLFPYSAYSYIKSFGFEPVCKQLLMGLIASLETICNSNDSTLDSRVQLAKSTLDKAHQVEKDLDAQVVLRKGILQRH